LTTVNHTEIQYTTLNIPQVCMAAIQVLQMVRN